MIGLSFDTIVAVATPAGTSAIGVIRLSGPGSLRIADALFWGKKASEAHTQTALFGKIIFESQDIDDVVLTVFRSPGSYTGEDIVEISCHGSAFILNRLMEVAVACGARPARPGEFTQRAFLNGKLDLSQAEAVADLIASETAASHRIAMQQLKGGFSLELKRMRDDLIRFASLVELELDFSEEDVEFANRNELGFILLSLKRTLEELIKSYSLGNVLKKGIPVAIAGKPNAGKSTLLNRLLNEERAIVSEHPGTTRDTLEEQIVLGGVPFRLIDTAGLRETSDEVELIGVQRAKDKMKSASVIVYLFDPNEVLSNELRVISAGLQADNPGVILLLVGTKADRHELAVLDKKYLLNGPVIWISARENINIDLLETEILKQVDLQKLTTGELIITNSRHFTALSQTLESVNATINLVGESEKSELLAFEIKSALLHLGEITGEVTNEDLLDSIFSKFCIGK